MPELPEVETVRKTLAKVLPGKTFSDVEIRYAGIIKKPTPEKFSELIKGKSITGVRRRGKFLLIDIEDTLVLTVHLRMTGRMVYTHTLPEDNKHIHVIFYLTDGSYLYFKDLRKFGTIYLLVPDELINIHGYAILGPEPLSEDFALKNFTEALGKSRKKIKQVLLDQKVVAGLGNIYADEALHLAEIHPERQALSLSPEEIHKLYQSVKEVIEEGIKHGGTSFRDYVDGFGEKGKHQEHLRVYQKLNQQCPRCGQNIFRIKIGGRSSYHCPNCQK